LNEFELIARYFTRSVHERQGVGDDCALMDVGDRTLAITTDLLTAGVHFFPDVAPASLGHKALAVNLSDLAAAGARPRCFLLSLSLARADPVWLEAFSRGMFELAAREGCELIGGDTTRAAHVAGGEGPVTVCITAIGEVDRSCLRGRGGARPGDDLWVSGELGDAAPAGSGWSGRNRGSRWDLGYAAWPPRPSTSPTACSETWATCCSGPGSEPVSRSPKFRGPARCSKSSRTCSGGACWRGATITSCCLPLLLPIGRLLQTPVADVALQ
jgi:thiamine monophosphate kinase